MNTIIVPTRRVLNSPVTKKQEVFDIDKFFKGVCIEAKYHDGTIYNAIISHADFGYIEAYRPNNSGGVCKVEIYLEDYLSGKWLIRRLN